MPKSESSAELIKYSARAPYGSEGTFTQGVDSHAT